MKLLVLADDLTGALDTGIQFTAGHANTRVVLDARYPLSKADPSVQVLVIDTESRHLSPENAAGIVQNIVRQAVDLKVPYLYKKTDSALRGNTGAELAAALEASGEHQLHFISAFPRAKRTTAGGIQLIDGVPVAESVFGQDPFEPVLHSAVAEILAEQTATAVTSVPLGDMVSEKAGIAVYDAATDDDIRFRAQELKSAGKLKLLAGCAGFAAMLPGMMELSGAKEVQPQYASSFLVACGSVNPITIAQLDEAERQGFRRIRITPEQALTPGWFEGPTGEALLAEWADLLKSGKNCILDTNPAPGGETAYDFAKKQALSLEEMRVQIARTMGRIIQMLLARGVQSTLLITGGDTLMGFMQTVGVSEIVPVRELVTGSVLSLVEIGGAIYNIISKSGGFGEKTLVSDLARLVLPQK